MEENNPTALSREKNTKKERKKKENRKSGAEALQSCDC